jgi:hypothetical protein
MKRAAVRNAESRPSVTFQSDHAERGRRSSPSPEAIRQRARSTWNGAEFTVASWTSGCRRNASSGKKYNKNSVQ